MPPGPTKSAVRDTEEGEHVGYSSPPPRYSTLDGRGRLATTDERGYAGRYLNLPTDDEEKAVLGGQRREDFAIEEAHDGEKHTCCIISAFCYLKRTLIQRCLPDTMLQFKESNDSRFRVFSGPFWGKSIIRTQIPSM